MWDVLSGVAEMAWDVLSGVAKMAWDVLSGVTKTAWDVLSGVANLCGMFCTGCQKMAWDVLPQIRQRLFDQCNQSIITAANGSQKLILYNQYKTECKLEPYLDLVCENKYKIALSRFRLSSHSLMIEIGRYNGTPREDRLCTFCNMRKKEDEYHFLLVCPYYTELRRRYFKKYFCSWPTLTKFDHLMSATSKKTLNNLSRFVYFAFKKRNPV